MCGTLRRPLGDYLGTVYGARLFTGFAGQLVHLLVEELRAAGQPVNLVALTEQACQRALVAPPPRPTQTAADHAHENGLDPARPEPVRAARPHEPGRCELELVQLEHGCVLVPRLESRRGRGL